MANVFLELEIPSVRSERHFFHSTSAIKDKNRGTIYVSPGLIFIRPNLGFTCRCYNFVTGVKVCGRI